MNPVGDLVRAWRGLGLAIAGESAAAAQFTSTPAGLAVALGWLLVALLLSAAAQSVGAGLPSGAQLAIGLSIQAATLAALAAAIRQSLRFLRSEVPLLALFVPIVYLMGLVQVLAIPLNLLGPNVQLIAVVILAGLIWRTAWVLGRLSGGVAAAFALLCLMVLVVVPNALYMLFLSFPLP